MVVEIATFMNEGLPHDVVGGIVEILGGESGAVNGLESGIGALDDVAFNQLHRRPPSFPAHAQSPRSYAWPVVAHTAAHRTNTQWRPNQPTSPLSRSRPG